MAVMLDPQTSRSFTPLSTLNLPHQHVLLPSACNPTMDLVVLLSPAGPSPSPSQTTIKGKEKALERNSWSVTKVGLWRMLGSKVWEIEVKGWIGAMAWSVDGLVLSILVVTPSPKPLLVQHFSVHDGSVIQSAPLDLAVIDPGDGQDVRGLAMDMEWRASSTDWSKPNPGSGMMVIDTLPGVTPVEPPKPAVVNPFAKQLPASSSKLPHSSLASFPSLLPITPSKPDTLELSVGSNRRRFLLGTFPLPIAAQLASPPSQILRLAQLSDRIAHYLNVVMRGLEAMDAAWRDAAKQTMIWREELENCASQQGMSVKDVHADLFRLLMTGRCREAVTDWLGSRLTGRNDLMEQNITKWGQVLQASFETIQKVISESVTPALERVIILLEDLRRWSYSSSHAQNLRLDSASVKEVISIACGFCKVAESMQQDAEHEAYAAASWILWLKYEAARSGSGGGDEPHTATYDLKLAWSFLLNGFVRSVFSTYFPDIFPRPPTDQLPATYLATLAPKREVQPLNSTLEQTIAKLSRRKRSARADSPQQRDPQGDDSENMHELSSMLASSPMVSTRQIEASMMMDEDESELVQPESDDDSDGMVSKPKAQEDLGQNGEQARSLHSEPWVWANTLIDRTEKVIRAALPLGDATLGEGLDPGILAYKDAMLTATWTSDDGVWVAATLDAAGSAFLVVNHTATEAKSPSAITFDLGSYACLGLQFFDASELALLLSTPGQGVFLSTIKYDSLLSSMVELPRTASLDQVIHPPITRDLTFARTRHISPPRVPGVGDVVPSMALNGRKGRRVGCVLGANGMEVLVWDMETDEDDELEIDGNGDEEEKEEDGMLEYD